MQCGVKNITYQKLVESHMLKECPKIKVKCKMEGCGQVILREQIKSHILNQCRKVMMECEVCETKIRFNEKNHSCA